MEENTGKLDFRIKAVIVIIAGLILYEVISLWIAGPLIQGLLTVVISLLSYRWLAERPVKFSHWVLWSILIGLIVFLLGGLFGKVWLITPTLQE